MKAERYRFVVEVNLDGVPGTFDNAEDFRKSLVRWGMQFPWYEASVSAPEYVGLVDRTPPGFPEEESADV